MTDRDPILNHPADPPALPRLIARVAVTGHRPPATDETDPSEGSRAIVKNDAGIRVSIRDILNAVVAIAADIVPVSEGAYSKERPVLRILSSLAEGADRMVAQEALAMRSQQDVKLECPLPAASKEYRNDFKTAASAEVFDQLLLAAKDAVFELGGQRKGDWLRAQDYKAAGHIAVSNCDLLIAIWDGKPGKEGGTAEIVEEALRLETPVLRINVEHPEQITMLTGRGPGEADWRPALATYLDRAFAPPQLEKEHSDKEPPEIVPLAANWVKRYNGERTDAAPRDPRRADELANRYGRLYRFSYRLKYGLSALAVLFAVKGIIYGPEQAPLWATLELASIGGILLCFLLAWVFDWHERWLDYRLLAEQFRVLGFLEPLGETVPEFRPPKYWDVQPNRHSSVRWYFRARLREVGLPRAVVEKTYVEKQIDNVLRVAKEQLQYNENKHTRSKLLHHVMEWSGLGLFALTALACVAHLGEWGPAFVLAALGALTATLPAFGAAFEGLQAQEEGRRIAGHAHAMSEHLKDVKGRIEKLKARIKATPPADVELTEIAGIAFELATEMTRETSGWHNLILGQPPKI
jgi:hypothetical protein